MIEPLLDPKNNTHCFFPVKYLDVYNFYLDSIDSFWNAREIDFSRDKNDWNSKLSDDEREFFKNIFAFFACADGLINENLVLNFCNEVTIPEAKAFYSYQNLNETIHNQCYSLLIDTYCTDKEKEILFNAVVNFPMISKKKDWMVEYFDTTNNSFGERLVAFACVEGIFFACSFAHIYWLKKRNLMPSLCHVNEFIARDESQHQKFACLLFSHLQNKTNAKRIYEIVQSAVDLEIKFISAALGPETIGLKKVDLIKYIQFVADGLLVGLGVERIYKVEQPFPWMIMINLEGKSNFFEHRVSNYSLGTAPKIDMYADTELF